MNLPDNILRQFLKNVYFISGSACGGKSTISRYLSEKHHITLFNWDEMYSRHKAMSDSKHQPYMNRKVTSWEAHFSQSPREYSESLRKSILEQVEIAVIELISLSKDRRILVDGVFPLSVLKKISSKDRIVFLMADMEAIRHDFFMRPDKQDMLTCIRNLRNPEQAMENVFRSIEYILDKEMAEIQESGFRWIYRGLHPDWEKMKVEVEQHFNWV